MIYLIDDNKIRQVDSGWDDSKLDKFKDYICPIYKLNDFTPDLKVKLFKGKDNVILFHESFFDNIENRQYKKDVNDIRNSLTDIADDSLNRLYVSFSGSNSERKLDAEKISGSIPVHILYQNLHVFIEEYRNQKKYNLDYLLYGSNIEIEPQLLKKLNVCKNNYIKEDITFPKEFNNYFFYRSRRDLNTPFKNFSTIFNTESENGLDKKIKETLKDIEFKGIFVPLCFGQTLSDFNGLRLATHIRCTPSKNQLKKIFIYSFVRLDEIIDCEYFNILKTKNVYFIDYRKKDFLNAFNDISEFLKPDELSDEIKKVKLEPPLNYADPHSIANEWAIYQWAKTIGCDKTDELAKVFQNVETNLYFKYLQTINPISEIDTILNEDLNIEPDEEFNNEHEDGTKVLLIDDEAEKGWHEIFAYLLGDLNEIYIDYLGDDFKNQSGEEIIDRSIQKIKDEDIDVVILDFRLNFNDFIGSNPKNISSIRLLEKIKAYNPGIQVIIFSATNKIWNLQTLQNAGADGFIFKDGSENILKTINSLIKQISLSLKRAFWLKPIWIKTKSTINHLEKQKKNHILDKDFIGAINTFLELGFEMLLNEQNKFSYDSSFMYYFLILEAVSKQLIDEDNPHEVNYTNKYGKTKRGFKFQFRSNYSFLKDYQGNGYMQIAIGEDLISSNKRIPYNSKFHNLISYARCDDIDPVSLVDLRNKFNHPDLIENRRIAIIEREHVNRIFEVCFKLLNNL